MNLKIIFISILLIKICFGDSITLSKETLKKLADKIPSPRNNLTNYKNNYIFNHSDPSQTFYEIDFSFKETEESF